MLSSQQFVTDHLQTFLRQTGPSISPFNAWVLLKGLETLGLRVERAQSSAATLADALAAEPKVEKVLYPFRADHPQAALARRQMTAAARSSPSWWAAARRCLPLRQCAEGDPDLQQSGRLQEPAHPSGTTTHQRFTPEARAEMGISDGLVRLSVGLEHPDDLVSDIVQALKAV